MVIIFTFSDTLERHLIARGGESSTVVYGNTTWWTMSLPPHKSADGSKATSTCQFSAEVWCVSSIPSMLLRAVAPEYDEGYRLSADFDWCSLRILSHPTCNSLILRTRPYRLPPRRCYHTASSESLRERFRIMCHHYVLFATLLSHLFFLLRLPFKRLSA